MALQIERVEVWATDLQDQPRDLARVLGQLAQSGSSVECVIARRESARPGGGVAFVSLADSPRANVSGLNRTESVATLRVEGDDRQGLGAELCRAVGEAGINMRGLSAAVLGRRFVAYFGFDSDADADRAAEAMRGVNRASGGRTPAGRRSGGGKTRAGRGRAAGAARGKKAAAKRGTPKRATPSRR